MLSFESHPYLTYSEFTSKAETALSDFLRNSGPRQTARRRSTMESTFLSVKDTENPSWPWDDRKNAPDIIILKSVVGFCVRVFDVLYLRRGAYLAVASFNEELGEWNNLSVNSWVLIRNKANRMYLLYLMIFFRRSNRTSILSHYMYKQRL